MVDLHIHSTASDGSMTPEEIVALSARRGLRAIAIADHDSVEACDRAIAAAKPHGIAVVPAVEMSSEYKGRDLHLLGYFVDLDNRQLRRFLRDMRVMRAERVRKALRRLRGIGVRLKGEKELLSQAPDRAIGRGLLARMLIVEGYASTMREAFRNYLSTGSIGHVDRGLPTPEEVITRLRVYGAVVVLAHPGVARIDHAIEYFVDQGVQGLEVYHPDHSPDDVERYSQMASNLGLAITGGSDCHGAHSDRGITLGTLDVPLSVYDGLKQRAMRTGILGLARGGVDV